jgi:excisionase family DNA binding protein
MSSNIKIQKNCEFCGNEFTARTLYTRYCSKSCNKKHYKQLLLEKNIETGQGQENIKISPLEILRNSSQEYFQINEAAQIMRISRATLYRLIKAKKLKKKKILSRTIISKEDIKSFFDKQ